MNKLKKLTCLEVYLSVYMWTVKNKNGYRTHFAIFLHSAREKIRACLSTDFLYLHTLKTNDQFNGDLSFCAPMHQMI